MMTRLSVVSWLLLPFIVKGFTKNALTGFLRISTLEESNVRTRTTIENQGFFVVPSTTTKRTNKLYMNDPKFGFGQRIESLKSLVVGAISGSFAMAPVSAIHNLVLLEKLAPIQTNTLAQWEFDNDMAGLESGLFAIVYRYCIRMDDNEQLSSGVTGAFVLTRTLSRVIVPSYCTAITLNCGEPLRYFDWAVLGQIGINLVESAALFGAAAAAMNYCFYRNIITKFPG